MLETERLRLREWREEDAVPFAQLNGDAKVMEHYPATLDREQSDAIVSRIMSHFKEHGFGLFAVELQSNNEFIGFIGLQHVPFEAHFTPAVEIGWRLASPHWNKGYATEGAIAVLNYAQEVLKLKEVVAMTTVKNMASRRVMEKIGMTYNPKDDFENPRLSDPKLKANVLYRTTWDTN